jgi:hypothetical protein
MGGVGQTSLGALPISANDGNISDEEPLTKSRAGPISANEGNISDELLLAKSGACAFLCEGITEALQKAKRRPFSCCFESNRIQFVAEGHNDLPVPPRPPEPEPKKRKSSPVRERTVADNDLVIWEERAEQAQHPLYDDHRSPRKSAPSCHLLGRWRHATCLDDQLTLISFRRTERQIRADFEDIGGEARLKGAYWPLMLHDQVFLLRLHARH